MHVYTRRDGQKIEAPYEKPVIVPVQDDKDAASHAWADARFATDIMAGHAFFFALLMPEELAAAERKQALEFKTDIARAIEGARIKSTIDPRLADRVRRGALNFVDELKRAV